MRYTTFSRIALAALTLLIYSPEVKAHTWIDSLRRIASNGTFVGAAGYMRSYYGRVGSNVDVDMVNKILGMDVISPTESMCKSTQNIGNQVAGYPTLQAAPGDLVALQYEENGHVTLPTTTAGENRSAGNGTVWVYGTTTPANTDMFANIHRVWNADGTGGDKRGKLLVTRSFDDGQCYQINQQPLSVARQNAAGGIGEVLCQTDLQIPIDAPSSGMYTLYWVWDFPWLSSTTGAQITNETYTVCMDISMTSQSVPSAGPFIANQNVGERAAQPQLEAPFQVDPYATVFVNQVNATSFSSGSFAASTDASLPSSPATALSAAATSKQGSPTVSPGAFASVTSSVAIPNASPSGQSFVTVTITQSVVTVTETAPPSASTESAAAAPSGEVYTYTTPTSDLPSPPTPAAAASTFSPLPSVSGFLPRGYNRRM